MYNKTSRHISDIFYAYLEHQRQIRNIRTCKLLLQRELVGMLTISGTNPNTNLNILLTIAKFAHLLSLCLVSWSKE
jgi:hypothetical protein